MVKMRKTFKERKEMVSDYFEALRLHKQQAEMSDIIDDLYKKCFECKESILNEDIINNSFVCPECSYHFRLRAAERLQLIVEPGTFEEINSDKKGQNPLNMPNYLEKLEENRQTNGINEAVITGIGKIENYTYAIAIMDSYFLMGSMGAVVGEKITLLVELATKRKLPLIIFSASGGARMQEGILSLVQMVKTSAAIGCHNDAGLLYISVLTNPTTGGVSASFAMLGDILIAEPDALIGFAGPRVIEQTINQTLPEGFQRAEFLKEKGFVDMVAKRKDLKSVIARLSRLHGIEVK